MKAMIRTTYAHGVTYHSLAGQHVPMPDLPDWFTTDTPQEDPHAP